jgi:mono/diheme cytochrome c family protein
MRVIALHARVTLALLAAVTAAGACREQSAVPPASTAAKSPDNALVISRHDNRVFAGGLMPPAERVVSSEAHNPKAAEEGAALFTSMNCDGCHGGGAVGAVGPSLTDGRWRYGGADADIFRSIAEGRPKGMPSFGGALQPATIWRLVAYIKSLPPPKDVPTESW